MKQWQQFALAIIVACGGLALIIIGSIQVKSDIWIAGAGILTTVGAWVGIPRPTDTTTSSNTAVSSPSQPVSGS